MYDARQDRILTTRNTWIALILFLNILVLIFSWKSFGSLRQIFLSEEREHEAVVRLEGLLARQKEMFAVIGHELRTPVAAISMISKDRDIDAQSARNEIIGLSENLLSVLEDLRVVVSPERALTEKKAEICDPVNVINRALSPLTNLLAQNSVALHLDIEKPAGMDFTLHHQPLRQVVTNLVKNAALHSGGSTVIVSFDYEVDFKGDALARLRIEDDGQGIPEGFRERIFEPFSRGSTEKDGTGLGLFIVKEIASMMGGTLDYSSSKSGGACFTLFYEKGCARGASKLGQHISRRTSDSFSRGRCNAETTD